jgi:hypothetical protein
MRSGVDEVDVATMVAVGLGSEYPALRTADARREL